MRLPHPLIVGAGPLGDDLDTVRALEDAGAAVIVLRSLFEEEITGEQMATSFNTSSATANRSPRRAASSPSSMLALGPDEYLEHLRRGEGRGRHSGDRVAQRQHARRLAVVRAG